MFTDRFNNEKRDISAKRIPGLSEISSRQKVQPWVKSLSLLTAMLFLFSQFSFAQFSASAPVEDVSVKGLIDLTQVSIPRDIAITKDIKRTTSEQLIINIKDVHDNYGAQESIVSVLENLALNYDVNFVGIEGSEGPIDMSLIESFPIEEVRRSAADSLMREGKISAGEFFRTVSGDPVKLYGIDDKDLYVENLETFLVLLEEKELNMRLVSVLREALDKLSENILSDELKLLNSNSILNSNRHGGRFTRKWREVEHIGLEHGVGHTRYENISGLLKAMEMEKRIDYDRTNRERDDVLDALASKVSRNILEEMVLKSLSFRIGRISTSQFYSYIVLLAKAEKIDPAMYSELQKYCDYVNIYESLDIGELMDEIDDYESRIRERIYRNDSERELTNLIKDVEILSNLYSTSITSGQLNYFFENKSSFSWKRFQDFIVEKYSQYGLQIPSELHEARLLFDKLNEAADFYRMAIARNQAMVNNTIARMKQDNVSVGAIITGGFHTRGITDILRSDRTSYIILLPRFNPQTGSRPYVTILTNKANEYARYENRMNYLAITSAFARFDNILTDADLETFSIGTKIQAIATMLAETSHLRERGVWEDYLRLYVSRQEQLRDRELSRASEDEKPEIDRRHKSRIDFLREAVEKSSVMELENGEKEVLVSSNGEYYLCEVRSQTIEGQKESQVETYVRDLSEEVYREKMAEHRAIRTDLENASLGRKVENDQARQIRLRSIKERLQREMDSPDSSLSLQDLDRHIPLLARRMNLGALSQNEKKYIREDIVREVFFRSIRNNELALEGLSTRRGNHAMALVMESGNPQEEISLGYEDRRVKSRGGIVLKLAENPNQVDDYEPGRFHQNSTFESVVLYGNEAVNAWNEAWKSVGIQRGDDRFIELPEMYKNGGLIVQEKADLLLGQAIDMGREIRYASSETGEILTGASAVERFILELAKGDQSAVMNLSEEGSDFFGNVGLDAENGHLKLIDLSSVRTAEAEERAKIAREVSEQVRSRIEEVQRAHETVRLESDVSRRIRARLNATQADFEELREALDKTNELLSSPKKRELVSKRKEILITSIYEAQANISRAVDFLDRMIADADFETKARIRALKSEMSRLHNRYSQAMLAVQQASRDDQDAPPVDIVDQETMNKWLAGFAEKHQEEIGKSLKKFAARFETAEIEELIKKRKFDEIFQKVVGDRNLEEHEFLAYMAVTFHYTTTIPKTDRRADITDVQKKILNEMLSGNIGLAATAAGKTIAALARFAYGRQMARQNNDSYCGVYLTENVGANSKIIEGDTNLNVPNAEVDPDRALTHAELASLWGIKIDRQKSNLSHILQDRDWNLLGEALDDQDTIKVIDPQQFGFGDSAIRALENSEERKTAERLYSMMSDMFVDEIDRWLSMTTQYIQQDPEGKKAISGSQLEQISALYQDLKELWAEFERENLERNKPFAIVADPQHEQGLSRQEAEAEFRKRASEGDAVILVVKGGRGQSNVVQASEKFRTELKSLITKAEHKDKDYNVEMILSGLNAMMQEYGIEFAVDPADNQVRPVDGRGAGGITKTEHQDPVTRVILTLRAREEMEKEIDALESEITDLEELQGKLGKLTELTSLERENLLKRVGELDSENIGYEISKRKAKISNMKKNLPETSALLESKTLESTTGSALLKRIVSNIQDNTETVSVDVGTTKRVRVGKIEGFEETTGINVDISRRTDGNVVVASSLGEGTVSFDDLEVGKWHKIRENVEITKTDKDEIKLRRRLQLSGASATWSPIASDLMGLSTSAVDPSTIRGYLFEDLLFESFTREEVKKMAEAQKKDRKAREAMGDHKKPVRPGSLIRTSASLDENLKLIAENMQGTIDAGNSAVAFLGVSKDKFRNFCNDLLTDGRIEIYVGNMIEGALRVQSAVEKLSAGELGTGGAMDLIEEALSMLEENFPEATPYAKNLKGQIREFAERIDKIASLETADKETRTHEIRALRSESEKLLELASEEENERLVSLTREEEVDPHSSGYLFTIDEKIPPSLINSVAKSANSITGIRSGKRMTKPSIIAINNVENAQQGVDFRGDFDLYTFSSGLTLREVVQRIGRITRQDGDIGNRYILLDEVGYAANLKEMDETLDELEEILKLMEQKWINSVNNALENGSISQEKAAELINNGDIKASLSALESWKKAKRSARGAEKESYQHLMETLTPEELLLLNAAYMFVRFDVTEALLFKIDEEMRNHYKTAVKEWIDELPEGSESRRQLEEAYILLENPERGTSRDEKGFDRSLGGEESQVLTGRERLTESLKSLLSNAERAIYIVKAHVELASGDSENKKETLEKVDSYLGQIDAARKMIDDSRDKKKEEADPLMLAMEMTDLVRSALSLENMILGGRQAGSMIAATREAVMAAAPQSVSAVEEREAEKKSVIATLSDSKEKIALELTTEGTVGYSASEENIPVGATVSDEGNIYSEGELLGKLETPLRQKTTREHLKILQDGLERDGETIRMTSSEGDLLLEGANFDRLFEALRALPVEELAAIAALPLPDPEEPAKSEYQIVREISEEDKKEKQGRKDEYALRLAKWLVQTRLYDLSEVSNELLRSPLAKISPLAEKVRDLRMYELLSEDGRRRMSEEELLRISRASDPEMELLKLLANNISDQGRRVLEHSTPGFLEDVSEKIKNYDELTERTEELRKLRLTNQARLMVAKRQGASKASLAMTDARQRLSVWRKEKGVRTLKDDIKGTVGAKIARLERKVSKVDHRIKEMQKTGNVFSKLTAGKLENQKNRLERKIEKLKKDPGLVGYETIIGTAAEVADLTKAQAEEIDPSRIENARVSIEEGEMGAAINILEQVLRDNWRIPEALVLLSQAYLGSAEDQKPEEKNISKNKARRLNKYALYLDPENIEARKQEILLLKDEGKNDEALLAAMELQKQKTAARDLDVLSLSAEIAKEQKELDKEILFLEKLKKQADDPGQIRKADIRLAHLYSEKAIEVEKNRAQRKKEISEKGFSRKILSSAFDGFKTGESIYPAGATAKSVLKWAGYVTLGVVFSGAVILSGGSIGILAATSIWMSSFSSVFIALGSMKIAIPHIEKGVSRFKDSRLEKNAASLRHKTIKSIDRELSRTDISDQDRVNLLEEKSQVIFDTHADEKVLGELEKILGAIEAIRPAGEFTRKTHARVLGRLAELKKEAGKADEALNHLKRARELDGSNLSVTLALIDIHLEKGRPEDALRLVRKARGTRESEHWRDVELLRRGFKANQKLKRVGTEALRHAHAVYPEDVRITELLYEALIHSGKLAAACSVLRYALRENPENKTLLELLKKSQDRLIEANKKGKEGVEEAFKELFAILEETTEMSLAKKITSITGMTKTPEELRTPDLLEELVKAIISAKGLNSFQKASLLRDMTRAPKEGKKAISDERFQAYRSAFEKAKNETGNLRILASLEKGLAVINMGLLSEQGQSAALQHLEKMENLMRRGNFSETRWAEMYTLKKDVLSMEPDTLIGLKHEDVGDKTKAKKRYERALKSHPEDLMAHLRLAQLASENEDYDAAKKHYSEIARIEPGALPKVEYLRLLLKTGETDEVVQQYGELTPDQKKQLSENERKGMVSLFETKESDAKKNTEKMLLQASETPSRETISKLEEAIDSEIDILRSLEELLEDDGAFSDRINELKSLREDRIYQRRESVRVALLGKAKELESKRSAPVAKKLSIRKAIDSQLLGLYADLLELRPEPEEKSKIYSGLIAAYLRQGSITKAIDSKRKARIEGISFPASFDEEIDTLSRSMQADLRGLKGLSEEEKARRFLNLGLLFEISGRDKQAISHYEEAKKTDSTSAKRLTAEAEKLLAWQFLFANDLERAEALLKEASGKGEDTELLSRELQKIRAKEETPAIEISRKEVFDEWGGEDFAGEFLVNNRMRAIDALVELKWLSRNRRNKQRETDKEIALQKTAIADILILESLRLKDSAPEKREEIEKAIRYYDEAILIDSNLQSARIGLCRAYLGNLKLVDDESRPRLASELLSELLWLEKNGVDMEAELGEAFIEDAVKETIQSIKDLSSKEKHKGVEERYQLLQKLSPDRSKTNEILTIMETTHSRQIEALRAKEKLTAEDKKELEKHLLRLAETQDLLKRPTGELEEHYGQVLKINKRSLKAKLGLAKILIKNGQIRKAINMLKKVAKDAELKNEAKSEIVRAYLIKEDFTEAQKALGTLPEEYQEKQAFKKELVKKLKEKSAQLETALKEAPDISLTKRSDRLKEIVLNRERLVALESDDHDLLRELLKQKFQLAVVLSSRGRSKESIELITGILEKISQTGIEDEFLPGNAKELLIKAYKARLSKNIDEAERAGIHIRLTEIYAEKEDTVQAREHYSKARLHGRKDIGKESSEKLSSLLTKQANAFTDPDKNKEKALKLRSYQRAIFLDSTNSEAFFRKAELLKETDSKKAEDLYRKSLSGKGEFAEKAGFDLLQRYKDKNDREALRETLKTMMGKFSADDVVLEEYGHSIDENLALEIFVSAAEERVKASSKLSELYEKKARLQKELDSTVSDKHKNRLLQEARIRRRDLVKKSQDLGKKLEEFSMKQKDLKYRLRTASESRRPGVQREIKELKEKIAAIERDLENIREEQEKSAVPLIEQANKKIREERQQISGQITELEKSINEAEALKRSSETVENELEQQFSGIRTPEVGVAVAEVYLHGADSKNAAEKAKKVWENKSAHTETRSRAHFVTGEAYGKEGRKEDASDQYLSSLQADPEKSPALEKLSSDKSRFNEALETLCKEREAKLGKGEDLAILDSRIEKFLNAAVSGMVVFPEELGFANQNNLENIMRQSGNAALLSAIRVFLRGEHMDGMIFSLTENEQLAPEHKASLILDLIETGLAHGKQINEDTPWVRYFTDQTDPTDETALVILAYLAGREQDIRTARKHLSALGDKKENFPSLTDRIELEINASEMERHWELLNSLKGGVFFSLRLHRRMRLVSKSLEKTSNAYRLFKRKAPETAFFVGKELSRRLFELAKKPGSATFESRIQVLKRSAEISPEPGTAYLEIALLYQSREVYGTALQNVERAIGLISEKKSLSEAKDLKSQLLRSIASEEDDPQKQITLLSKAAEINPEVCLDEKFISEIEKAHDRIVKNYEGENKVFEKETKGAVEKIDKELSAKTRKLEKQRELLQRKRHDEAESRNILDQMTALRRDISSLQKEKAEHASKVKALRNLAIQTYEAHLIMSNIYISRADKLGVSEKNLIRLALQKSRNVINKAVSLRSVFGTERPDWRVKLQQGKVAEGLDEPKPASERYIETVQSAPRTVPEAHIRLAGLYSRPKTTVREQRADDSPETKPVNKYLASLTDLERALSAMDRISPGESERIIKVLETSVTDFDNYLTSSEPGQAYFPSDADEDRRQLNTKISGIEKILLQKAASTRDEETIDSIFDLFRLFNSLAPYLSDDLADANERLKETLRKNPMLPESEKRRRLLEANKLTPDSQVPEERPPVTITAKVPGRGTLTVLEDSAPRRIIPPAETRGLVSDIKSLTGITGDYEVAISLHPSLQGEAFFFSSSGYEDVQAYSEYSYDESTGKHIITLHMKDAHYLSAVKNDELILKQILLHEIAEQVLGFSHAEAVNLEKSISTDGALKHNMSDRIKFAIDYFVRRGEFEYLRALLSEYPRTQHPLDAQGYFYDYIHYVLSEPLSREAIVGIVGAAPEAISEYNMAYPEIFFISGLNRESLMEDLKSYETASTRVLVDFRDLAEKDIPEIVENVKMHSFMLEIAPFLSGMDASGISNLESEELLNAFNIITSSLPVEIQGDIDGMLERLYKEYLVQGQYLSSSLLPETEDALVEEAVSSIKAIAASETETDRSAAAERLFGLYSGVRDRFKGMETAQQRRDRIYRYESIAIAQALENEATDLLRSEVFADPGVRALVVDAREHTGVDLYSIMPGLINYARGDPDLKAAIITDTGSQIKEDLPFNLEEISSEELGEDIAIGAQKHYAQRGIEIKGESIVLMTGSGNISREWMVDHLRAHGEESVNFVLTDKQFLREKNIGERINRLIPTLAIYSIVRRYGDESGAPSVLAVGLSETAATEIRGRLKDILHHLDVIRRIDIGAEIRDFINAVRQVAISL